MLGCHGAGLSGLRDSWAKCAQVRIIGIHRNANGQIAQDCPSVASFRVGEEIVLRIDMACGLGGRSPSSTVLPNPSLTQEAAMNEVCAASAWPPVPANRRPSVSARPVGWMATRRPPAAPPSPPSTLSPRQ